MKRCAVVALAVLTSSVLWAQTQPASRPAKPAAPKAKALVFTDSATAPADYKIQGEYQATAKAADGKESRLGIQVIALANGKFRAVLLAGGLPGEGFDGKTHSDVDGTLADGKATFTGPTSLLIEGDGITGKTDKGETITGKKVVRESPTLGARPPAGALVLFDGSNTDAWKNGRMTEDKLLMVGCTSKQEFGNYTLHVEFRTPFMPASSGQGRGNSGVYMQDRYEIQVLDSFGLKGADNECGGIYKNAAPKVNMCFPPLTWQTYDVNFTGPRFGADGKKTSNARITVKHNGVVIHENLEIKGPTGGGHKKEDGPTGPIYLQDHGNPVVYRNVWIVEEKGQ